jgi:hypothetical protein
VEPPLLFAGVPAKERRDLMVGYVAYLFERNLGRPVRVELLESLRGAGRGIR